MCVCGISVCVCHLCVCVWHVCVCVQARTELDQIAVRLQEDGLPPGASSEERQRHLWRQLREGDEALRSSQQEMLALRTQQASEMKEVGLPRVTPSHFEHTLPSKVTGGEEPRSDI